MDYHGDAISVGAREVLAGWFVCLAIAVGALLWMPAKTTRAAPGLAADSPTRASVGAICHSDRPQPKFRTAEISASTANKPRPLAVSTAIRRF
jgi:hypothetical protein